MGWKNIHNLVMEVLTLYKKWSFSLQISSVNVIKPQFLLQKWPTYFCCLFLKSSKAFSVSLKRKFINPFHATGLFLYPLKASEYILYVKIKSIINKLHDNLFLSPIHSCKTKVHIKVDKYKLNNSSSQLLTDVHHENPQSKVIQDLA